MERYERLRTRRLGDIRILDLSVSEWFGLADRVRELLDVGSWRRFFEIQDTVLRELTLELLVTFPLDRT